MCGGKKTLPDAGDIRESVATARGPVEFLARATPQLLAGLVMDKGLKNFRPPKRQHKALIHIAGLSEGRVSIAKSGLVIVGYVTFHRPHPYSEWIRHPLMLEVGGIEVSSSWRRCGIASRLLKVAFSCPSLEDYIVFTTEYCWHWDLEGTGLEIWEYRNVMIKLFEGVGMVKMDVRNRDINAHPANVFMARFGRNIPAEQVEAFRKLFLAS